MIFSNMIIKRLIRLCAEKNIGKMLLEEIACFVPSLSIDELKELEAEVMQLE